MDIYLSMGVPRLLIADFNKKNKAFSKIESFVKSYGEDIKVATGMAVVSHLLSCITIPMVFLVI